ncbi:MAG: hypothetical protein R2704_05895 [Microthrixaceae bacterium]
MRIIVGRPRLVTLARSASWSADANTSAWDTPRPRLATRGSVTTRLTSGMTTRLEKTTKRGRSASPAANCTSEAAATVTAGAVRQAPAARRTVRTASGSPAM